MLDSNSKATISEIVSQKFKNKLVMILKALAFSVLLAAFSFKKGNDPIAVIDLVKIKSNNRSEAVYFYQNNCLKYRQVAVKKGYISSYSLMIDKKVSDTSLYDIMLITVYPDSLAYKNSEINFRKIIDSLRPNGPLLINGLKPNEFREIVSNRHLTLIQ